MPFFSSPSLRTEVRSETLPERGQTERLICFCSGMVSCLEGDRRFETIGWQLFVRVSLVGRLGS